MKYHLRFQIRLICNLKFVLLSFVLIFVSGLVYVYQSHFFVGKAQLDAFPQMYREMYIDDSMIFFKIISTLYAVFLFGSSHDFNNRQFVLFVYQQKHDYNLYLFSKQLVLVIVFDIFILHQYALFHLVYSIFTPLSLNSSMTYSAFIYIGLESLFFGVFTSYLMIYLSHPFSYMLPILIFWVLEILCTNADKQILSALKPILSVVPIVLNQNHSFKLTSPWYYYLIIMVLLIFVFIQVNLSRPVQTNM